MKNVALHNLGCKVNAYEIDVMQQNLIENGYGIVRFDEKADIYIVNTCSVTNIAERKSRQMLHRAKKKNPDAIVVAVGCYVQTKEMEVVEDICVDLVIGNNKKKDLVPILEQYFSNKEEMEDIKSLNHETIIDINATKEYEESQLRTTTEHTRAYIKIQDGCNQFCTYCIIPYARGRVRSRKEEDIYAEIKGLVENGFQEVVLTGIHISSYGVDLKYSMTLIDLVEKIQTIEGLERIRLGSLEPRIITQDGAKRLAAISKLCPHFHLSLQSGCDETLKRMNRRYTSREYYNCVKQLREVFEHPAITTDVIVGFPGETEEEFVATEQFIQSIAFSEMHIFKYSKRDGTIAAEMKEQVSEQDKSKRSDRLMKVAEKLAQQYKSAYIEKEETVLIEETKEINGQVYAIGYTKTYLKVAVLSKDNLKNKFVSGKITGFLTADLLFMEYIG